MLTSFLELVLGIAFQRPLPRPGVVPNVVGLELRYALRDLHSARFHAAFRRCAPHVTPAVAAQQRSGRTVRLVLEPMHSQGVGRQPNCVGPWTFVR